MGLVRRELWGMPIQLWRIRAHILLPFELSIGHRIEGTRNARLILNIQIDRIELW